MRKLILLIWLAYIVLLAVLFAAQWNYKQAVKASTNSCGTDACIEETMYAYGFELEWYLIPTLPNKLRALKIRTIKIIKQSITT